MNPEMKPGEEYSEWKAPETGGVTTSEQRWGEEFSISKSEADRFRLQEQFNSALERFIGNPGQDDNETEIVNISMNNNPEEIEGYLQNHGEISDQAKSFLLATANKRKQEQTQSGDLNNEEQVILAGDEARRYYWQETFDRFINNPGENDDGVIKISISRDPKEIIKYLDSHPDISMEAKSFLQVTAEKRKDEETSNQTFKIGDEVLWENNGTLLWEEPKKIISIKEDQKSGKKYAFFNDSNTGLPLEELIPPA